MRRKLKFVLVIVYLSISGFALFSSASGGQVKTQKTTEVQNPQQPKDVFELERAKKSPKPALESRLGKDDGFVAAIFYGGDILGDLEVCG